MDIGETTINLLSNKGEGYRNNWNPIIFLVFAALIFSFLIFAGFLIITNKYSLKTVLEAKNVVNSI